MTNTNTNATTAAAVWNFYDMQAVKYRDQITFTLYGETVTRSAHAAKSNDGLASAPWVMCNGEKVYLQYAAPVTHVNGMPLDEWRTVNNVPAPRPVNPAPAMVETATETAMTPAPAPAPTAKAPKANPAPAKAPKAPKAPKSPANDVTTLRRLIAEYAAKGETAKVDALLDMLVSDSDTAQFTGHSAPLPPAPACNPNKQGRVTAPAAPIAPKCSNVVTMPQYDACNTVEKTHKNYVDPRVFMFFDEIQADALELAKAACCNIRVYFRGTWVWMQPVNVAKDYGRSDAFKQAALTLPHGYRYSREQLADLTPLQRQQVMATELYQHAEKRGQVRRVLPLF